jgi:glycosyltransferase involved in cell wall biosynthesis
MSEALEALNLRGIVEFLPRVPYSQSLAALAEADLLLLLQASPDTTGLVPAKLYEYLRAQKPVLALVHEGATGEVLALTGGGWSVAPENQERLAETLARAFSLWRRGELDAIRAAPEALHRFDRKALAGQLAAIFDRVAGSSARAEPALRRV